MKTFVVHYPYKGGSVCRINAETSDAAKEAFCQNYPQITPTKIEEVAVVTKVPGCLKEMKISWTPALVQFIEHLARTGSLWIETTPKHSTFVENKYHELTGEVLMETPGQYVVANWDKWGTESKVTFDSDTVIPDDVQDFLQPSVDGVIDRNDFFWSLVRLGFRIGDSHNLSVIRNNIPESFRAEVA